MDKFSDQKRAYQHLYPTVDPFSAEIIDTGDGHHIYIEQCGNPQGRPVVVVHGGPGGGCSPIMRRYFNPEQYHIILFDQRGCGRSKPQASVTNNTTWHLVQDMEAMRQRLGLEKWALFGGSWGATLALIYAQTHPERVSHLILRGVFTMTQNELAWFYGGGASQFWPDAWEKFIEKIPEDERDDLIAAFHRRLFSGDLRVEIQFGRIWSAWETALASVYSDGRGGEAPSDYARTFARLENHYFINNGFLDHDGQILNAMERIAHIPRVDRARQI
jgi:proline iminopeptidase